MPLPPQPVPAAPPPALLAARLRRWRVLVLLDAAGYVLVSATIVVMTLSEMARTQAQDPSGYSSLSSFAITVVFGAPIVPVTILSLLLGLLGGGRAVLARGRWGGFGRRVGQLALSAAGGALVAVLIGALVFFLSAGAPISAQALGATAGIGGVALGVAILAMPVLLAIGVAAALIVRLLLGGPDAGGRGVASPTLG